MVLNASDVSHSSEVTTARTRVRRPRALGRASLLAPVAALLLAGGCHSKSDPTPQNFTQGIAKYLLDHPDCLYKTAVRFPYETSDPAESKQMNSLVTAQQLERQVESSIHVSRYTPTKIGAAAAPRFCYGFRHVTGIESYTPPAKGADGFNESRVTYQYELQDVPVWSKTPEVLTAFPEMAKATSAPGTATLTMAQTGVGWQVPD